MKLNNQSKALLTIFLSVVFYEGTAAEGTATPAPTTTGSSGVMRAPPPPYDKSNAPMSLLGRDISLSSLDRRQSCYPQGKCSDGVCCPLDGTCCDNRKTCCKHTEWCTDDVVCCNRWEIACPVFCCYPGNGGCCDTTRLDVTDKSVQYKGLGWETIWSTCSDSGMMSQVTTQPDTSISYTFRGTGVMVYAARSRYSVSFGSQDLYLTERNTTTACDLGFTRLNLPCQEYTITIFPDTRQGQFELSGIAISGAKQCPLKSSTTTSRTATSTPTHSSAAQEVLKSGWTSWVVSAAFGLLLNA